MKSTAEEIERLLAADVFVIAAHAFMATFEGTKLGKQSQSAAANWSSSPAAPVYYKHPTQ